MLENVCDTYEVILGDPWFVQHSAVLAWAHGGSCTVTKGRQRILLESLSSMEPSLGLSQSLLEEVEAEHMDVPGLLSNETVHKKVLAPLSNKAVHMDVLEP